MRIIAAPREGNDILAEDRVHLSGWAPANDWLYLEFADAVDLLSRLRDEVQISQQLTEIEIVAHGNPAICNDVSLGNFAVVAESLRRLSGVTKATAVYLSGCNTGYNSTTNASRHPSRWLSKVWCSEHEATSRERMPNGTSDASPRSPSKESCTMPIQAVKML